MNQVTKDEALQLALDALAVADNIALVGVAYTPKSIDLGLLKIRGARDAIKQALAAQPAVPLTEDEMWDLLGRHPKLPEYTRAVEARYGITKG